MSRKGTVTDIRNCKRKIRRCYRADGERVRYGYGTILAHEINRLFILKERLATYPTGDLK